MADFCRYINRMPVVLRQLRRAVLTILIGGLLGATLVRFSPGWGLEEGEFDPHLSSESRQAARAKYAQEHNILSYYAAYLKAALSGDLGVSRTFNRPVVELMRERLPETARSLGFGATAGLLAGLALAIASAYSGWRTLDLAAATAGGLSLSVPAGLVALLCFWLRAPTSWAIALAVFPHIHRYSSSILKGAYKADHVFAARAGGQTEPRILAAHILWPAAPQLFALWAVAVSVAFGAAVPIEVICDSPGIGQMAWKAAVARDLPLLVGATLLITLMTVIATGVADLALATKRGQA
jgi:peptide/nickel transport system permease protein